MLHKTHNFHTETKLVVHCNLRRHQQLEKYCKSSQNTAEVFFLEENIMTTSCELDFHCVLFDSRAAPTWTSWGGRGAPLDGFRPERGSARLPLLLAAA